MKFQHLIAAMCCTALLTLTPLMMSAPVEAASTKSKKPAPQKAPAKPATPRPDLATNLEGEWNGDVTSDMRGSSRDNVAITIIRTAPNAITITSGYKRLPRVTVPLMQASGRTIARSGDTTVFYDPTANPPSLDVVFNGEVAWRGFRAR
jgi:hypothetical protein